MEDHFEGKSATDHLKEARKKGALAASEVHGVEAPGFWGAACDAGKETGFLLLVLFLLLLQNPCTLQKCFATATALLLTWALWKAGRGAFLGWARLGRMHRLISEERFEIEHNREQERQELFELYRAKGFSGPLLDEVVAVLMADDNRLLEVMLTEELGLKIESMEHPLRQALGALLGTLATGVVTLSLAALGAAVLPSLVHLTPMQGATIGALVGGMGMLKLFTFLAARLERLPSFSTIIWQLVWAILSASLFFFLTS